MMRRFRQALATEDQRDQLAIGACFGALFVVVLALVFLAGCARAPVPAGGEFGWDAGPDVPFCSLPGRPWHPSMSAEDRQLLCEPRRVQGVAP